MNDEKIKELLSISFLRLIAERAGFVSTRPLEDYGDDLVVNRLVIRTKLNLNQYFTTGKYLGFQVKCTTEKNTAWKAGKFSFDLKERSFNHLISRREGWEQEGDLPLILVVVVLPEDKAKWLDYDLQTGKLTLQGKAFWYFPDASLVASTNKRNQVISISRENQVNLDFFEKMFAKFQLKRVVK